MSIYVRQFFKALFIYALSFGILISIWEYINTGTIVPIKIIVQTGIFGIFMASFTIFWQKRKLEKQGIYDPSPEDFNVIQQKTVETNMDMTSVKEIIANSPETRNWKLKEDDRLLKYSTGVNLRSWGEKVTIKPENEKLIIRSEPKLKTTLFDYGRNRANVELLKEKIDNG